MNKLDYHFPMRQLAISALLAVGLMTVTFATAVQAQMHGPLPSVTSIGPGRTSTGPSPSLTSFGTGPFAGNNRNQFFNVPACCINPLVPGSTRPVGRPHHHPGFGRGGYGYGGYPIYATSYYYGDYSQPQAQPDDAAEEDQYRGGPTIFDRRGNGDYQRYNAPADNQSSEQAQAAPSAQPAPEEASDQPDTVLVFKDGRQLEIKNYAIQGNMLFDLTPGHARKVALSDLDIPATQKQNDDRGIDFQVPASASGS